MEDPVATAVDHLHRRLGDRVPDVLLTLGSGLAGIADDLEDAIDLTVDEVPGLVGSRVPGHASRLRVGRLAGREVIAQLGRPHLYEGHDVGAVTRMVEVAAGLGCSTFVVTNAAGGLDPSLDPGDTLLIDDHINLTGASPLVGRLFDESPRFLDLAAAYDPALRREAHLAAGELGVELRRGVYAGVVGPAYETPAEAQMLRSLGADAAGMSTVNEVIAARAHGLRVLGLSMITNVHGREEPTSHDDVLAVGTRAAGPLARLVVEVLARP